MNSLYQQLQPTQQTQLQQNQMSSLLKSSNNQNSNLMNMLQNLATRNPQMQNAMQLFQASNMTPKEFFFHYAQQNGVDPNQFLNSLM